MSISTYDELQDAVANWLNRDDLAERIPEFIMLAEKRMDRDLRRRTIVAPLTLTSGAQSISLPDDCVELRYVRHASTSRAGSLTITTPLGLQQYRCLSAGAPVAAAVINNTLMFDREPDSAYELEIIYFAAITPLADDAAVNTELEDAPDLYLFAALVEAVPFLEHDERVGLWEAKYQSALRALNMTRESAELGAAPVTMALPVVFG